MEKRNRLFSMLSPLVEGARLAIDSAADALIGNLGSREPSRTSSPFWSGLYDDYSTRHRSAISAFQKNGWKTALHRNRGAFDGKRGNGQRALRQPNQ